MGLSQYAYVALRSDVHSAAELSTLLGLAHDEAMVRGSRRADPPIPTTHAWKLVCRDPTLPLDEQVEQVLRRIEPVADRIRQLTAGEVAAELVLVRDLDDDAVPPPVVEFDDGQHRPDWGRLLGWALSAETVGLLARIRASIDVDEYGAG